MRLTRGLYRPNGKQGLFDLACGQVRSINLHAKVPLKSDRVLKNFGWYNRRGEKLGWGDISFCDMFRIRDNLDSGEVLFFLCEEDSFWEFVLEVDPTGGEVCVVDDKIYAPGLRYVLEKCVWFVIPGRVFKVHESYYSDPDVSLLDQRVSIEDDGYWVTLRERIKEIVQGSMHLRSV